MDEQRAGRGIRIILMVVTGLVTVTAFAGGAALVAGSLAPDLSNVIVPPPEYLEGSPFDSYLLPGIVLALVLGGVHLVAFVLLARRHARALLAVVVAGYAAVIWIVVQMTIIPFSPLQAVYATLGLAEIGLVLLALGIFRPALAGRLSPGR